MLYSPHVASELRLGGDVLRLRGPVTVPNWWRRPQQTASRRILWRVHQWTGVFLAAYVLVISLTGASLVFRAEIEDVTTNPQLDPASLAGPPADLLTVAERLRAAYSDREVASIVNPHPEHRTIRAYLSKQGRYFSIDVHPVTGAVLGEVATRASALRWLQDLHFDLLAGRTGRLVNGAAAMLVLLLAGTGLVLWWPGVRTWTLALGVDFRRNWKGVTWELHRATGFWTSALLVMWALTGVYFAWPEQFRAVVNAVSPVSRAKIKPVDPDQAAAIPPPPLSALVQRAIAGTPGGQLLSISFANGPRSHFRVYVARELPMSYDTADVHYFHPRTGESMGVWRPGLNPSAGDLVMSWIVPLHFGTFGGKGVTGWLVKGLWTLLGLTPGALAVTGLLIYWNRYLGKRWARRRVSAGNGHSPAAHSAAPAD